MLSWHISVSPLLYRLRCSGLITSFIKTTQAKQTWTLCGSLYHPLREEASLSCYYGCITHILHLQFPTSPLLSTHWDPLRNFFETSSEGWPRCQILGMFLCSHFLCSLVIYLSAWLSPFSSVNSLFSSYSFLLNVFNLFSFLLLQWSSSLRPTGSGSLIYLLDDYS